MAADRKRIETMFLSRRNLLSLVLVSLANLLSAHPVMAKNLPLKPGTYQCFTIGTLLGQTPLPTDLSEINRAAAGNKIRPMVAPQIMLAPAAFGNVVLDGKGTYRMPTIGQSGKYGFNPATGRPTFTGDLGVMLQREYSGTGTSFFVGLQGTNFQCGLLGAGAGSPNAPAKVAGLGPALRTASAKDLTGHFEGSYICQQGETPLALDFLANDQGRLVAQFSFGGGNGSAKGSFTLVGSWNGARFNLKAHEWLNQPDGFVMVDIDGEVTARGVSGNILTPGCSNFSAVRGN
jgi:hypothetical protein